MFQIHGLAYVGLGLIGWAFAGLCGGDGEACASDDAGKQGIAAEAALLFRQKHLRYLLLAKASAERNGRFR